MLSQKEKRDKQKNPKNTIVFLCVIVSCFVFICDELKLLENTCQIFQHKGKFVRHCRNHVPLTHFKYHESPRSSGITSVDSLSFETIFKYLIYRYFGAGRPGDPFRKFRRS